MLLRVCTALAACLVLGVIGGCAGGATGIRVGDCTAPERCECTPDTPSRGMYCVQENLAWHDVAIPTENGILEHRFKWAKAVTGGGQCLVLIAGAIGDPNAADLCERGVLPPSKTPHYKAGLTLRTERGGADAPERATIAGGFLVLMASEAGSKVQGMSVKAWPLIVGTPSFPGAAPTGKAVFLTVPDFDNTSLRECVFRPNQHNLCDTCDSYDHDTSETVYVDWADKSGHEWSFPISWASYVDFIGGDANHRGLEGDEARFVRDVCRFTDQAMNHLEPGTIGSGCR